MFKQSLKLRPLYYSITLQTSQLSSTKQILCFINETQTSKVPASSMGTHKKYDLYSAVYVERHPLIVKPMNDIENRYAEMLRAIEYERSHLSDHEIRKKADEKQANKQLSELPLDVLSKETAQDFEDAAMKERNGFEFASVFTEDDKCNNLTSINRKLDSSLVLVTEHKYVKSTFLPPQGPRLDGETMRQTAERVLQEACGSNLKVKFYGNAPIGFYKYCYPRTMREKGTYGAKVFYFMAKYISGEPTCKRYQWVEQQNLSKELPKNVYKCVSQFIIVT